MRSVTTTRIERDDWPSFFDRISRSHAGWSASIESFDGDGYTTQVLRLPFEGVVCDQDASGGCTCEVLVGSEPSRHLSRTLVEPVSVRLKEEEDERGCFESIVLEAGDGTRTVIRFNSGILPEQADGFA